MVLSITDIAALASASHKRVRIADPAARELAAHTARMHREAALEDARRSAERFSDYTDSQHERIRALREVHWPRVRAFRDALSACDDKVSRHLDKHDDYVLTVRELEDVLIRSYRLVHLIGRAYAASASIGRFPVSRHDMRTDKRTRFLGSAAARHFTFAGGRDWGSAEYDPADIVQGAFVRAIDAGDTVHGVPTFGSLFRHIQTERAHLTRVNNAEYSARKRAALGHVTGAVEDWPDMTDKHAMRLLGTRNYATLDDHRLSLAIAHRDAELEQLDDAVTHSARVEALDGASETEFHVIVARVLMNGATMDEISSALGLTPASIISEVHRSKSESLRPIDTGIDHSERSVDMHNAAEREREIAEAEERHAAMLREREVIRATVLYATKRAA